MINILYLSNNPITHDLYYQIKNLGYNILIFDKKININFLLKNNINFIISYNYKYLIKKDIIDFVKGRIINMHISYLPWNRGADPNFWSFIENTPKGITIHQINEGLDTGDIILQNQVEFNENIETLNSTYIKLHNEIQKLLINNFSDIINMKIKNKPQIGNGSFHYSKHFLDFKNYIGNEIWFLPIVDLKEKYKFYKKGN
ncbi:MAG: formyl transferase [Candidatus Muirbacterium halophilum]|nr:formyl transferase [Candidatus Muirbacterium halophilum]MCK9477187.1 formyl transferase [Candidatus Muirbacterium halophilum]